MKKYIVVCVLLGCTLVLYGLHDERATMRPGEGNAHSLASRIFEAAAYEEETKSLTLVFHRGGGYIYHNVPNVVFREFMDAPAKGAYFNTHIRTRYPYRRVSESTAGSE